MELGQRVGDWVVVSVDDGLQSACVYCGRRVSSLPSETCCRRNPVERRKMGYAMAMKMDVADTYGEDLPLHEAWGLSFCDDDVLAMKLATRIIARDTKRAKERRARARDDV